MKIGSWPSGKKVCQKIYVFFHILIWKSRTTYHTFVKFECNFGFEKPFHSDVILTCCFPLFLWEICTSKDELVEHGEGGTDDPLCRESWMINIGRTSKSMGVREHHSQKKITDGRKNRRIIQRRIMRKKNGVWFWSLNMAKTYASEGSTPGSLTVVWTLNLIRSGLHCKLLKS